MPKVSEAHVQARREQVLDAARGCFARKGFHQTTIDDICGEAGLSPGAVYGYFASKEEIIETIAEEAIAVYRPLLDDLVANEDGFAAVRQLDRFAYRQMEKPSAADNRALDIELWAEALRSDRIRAVLQRYLDSYREPMRASALRAQADGRIADDLDADAFAQIGLSFYLGFVVQKALDPRIDVWKYVEVSEALLNGKAVAARPRDE